MCPMPEAPIDVIEEDQEDAGKDLVRIMVYVRREVRDTFRQAAEKENLKLSPWMAKAARRELRRSKDRKT